MQFKIFILLEFFSFLDEKHLKVASKKLKIFLFREFCKNLNKWKSDGAKSDDYDA
jgi:hypothetical protein